MMVEMSIVTFLRPLWRSMIKKKGKCGKAGDEAPTEKIDHGDAGD